MKIGNTKSHEKNEPNGSWSYYHMSVNFDDVECRKIYWMMRNDPHYNQMQDEEIKNLIVSIKEFAEIAYSDYKAMSI